jgi:hypothetical protein
LSALFPLTLSQRRRRVMRIQAQMEMERQAILMGLEFNDVMPMTSVSLGRPTQPATIPACDGCGARSVSKGRCDYCGATRRE